MGTCFCRKAETEQTKRVQPTDFSDYLPNVLADLTFQYANEWHVGDFVLAYLRFTPSWYKGRIFRVDDEKDYEIGVRLFDCPIRVGYYRYSSQFIRPTRTPDEYQRFF